MILVLSIVVAVALGIGAGVLAFLNGLAAALAVFLALAPAGGLVAVRAVALAVFAALDPGLEPRGSQEPPAPQRAAPWLISLLPLAAGFPCRPGGPPGRTKVPSAWPCLSSRSRRS